MKKADFLKVSKQVIKDDFLVTHDSCTIVLQECYRDRHKEWTASFVVIDSYFVERYVTSETSIGDLYIKHEYMRSIDKNQRTSYVSLTDIEF